MSRPASRRILLPLVPLYAGVIETKQWLMDRGWLSRHRLKHPVISVGSLSAGGAGKTPVVLMLAELLGQRGFEVRILTRGYGRIGKLTERVDPIGDPSRFGDEPLLLARRAGAASSVWVGADRYEAGALSQRRDTPDTRVVYLLDDGFQHRKLARAIDLLLLTRQDLDDMLLPAGNLREPLNAIARADLVLLRDDEVGLAGELEVRLAGALPPTIPIRRRLSFPPDARLPHRPLVFCGLARPEGFLQMLQQQGLIPVAQKIFRDHHPYSMGDIEALAHMADSHKADGFITTEKDAVKLSPAMTERLEEAAGLLAPRLDVEMVDRQAGLDTLLGLLEDADRGIA